MAYKTGNGTLEINHDSTRMAHAILIILKTALEVIRQKRTFGKYTHTHVDKCLRTGESVCLIQHRGRQGRS